MPVIELVEAIFGWGYNRRFILDLRLSVYAH